MRKNPILPHIAGKIITQSSVFGSQRGENAAISSEVDTVHCRQSQAMGQLYGCLSGMLFSMLVTFNSVKLYRAVGRGTTNTLLFPYGI